MSTSQRRRLPKPKQLTNSRQDCKQRAQQLQEQQISFIASEGFGDKAMQAVEPIVERVEAGQEIMVATEGGQGLPAHLRRLCATPLLNAQEEHDLFFRMNYCKYHAAAVLATLNASRPSLAKVEEAEDYLLRAERLRNYLLQANTRLVVSIARKFADARNSFDDLLSCGLTSLVRAVEKFDCGRGYRFSTYATCAVRRDLNRLLMTRRRDAVRFATTPGDVLETVAEESFDHPDKAVDRWQALSQLLAGMMEKLDDRERQIIRARFGFDEDGKKTSFSYLGKRMGISKERVRQLANRALDKLREHDEMGKLEGFC
jgi:RNA polymerase sigma factor (sigma-70 family)